MAFLLTIFLFVFFCFIFYAHFSAKKEEYIFDNPIENWENIKAADLIEPSTPEIIATSRINMGLGSPPASTAKKQNNFHEKK